MNDEVLILQKNGDNMSMEMRFGGSFFDGNQPIIVRECSSFVILNKLMENSN